MHLLPPRLLRAEVAIARDFFDRCGGKKGEASILLGVEDPRLKGGLKTHRGIFPSLNEILPESSS